MSREWLFIARYELENTGIYGRETFIYRREREQIFVNRGELKEPHAESLRRGQTKQKYKYIIFCLPQFRSCDLIIEKSMCVPRIRFPDFANFAGEKFGRSRIPFRYNLKSFDMKFYWPLCKFTGKSCVKPHMCI